MSNAKKPKIRYSIEYTDTFGGDLNYSWVKRFDVYATSFLGAARIASNEIGIYCRKNWIDYDQARYDSRSGCSAFMIYANFED